MVVVALLFGLLFLLLFLAFRRPSGLPPGIWGLPVVGRLPSGSEPLSDQVIKLRKVYGDIITWRMGCLTNVFLCNYDVIKNAMKRPELSDRPHFHTYTVLGKGKMLGLVFSNGSLWQRNRRFTLRQMRELGMGRTTLEEAMQEEARLLVQDFKRHTDKDQPLPLSLGVAVLNNVWKLVADTRYDLNDRKAHDFITLICSTSLSLQGPIFLFNVFPWLLTLAPPFLKTKLGYYVCENYVKEVHEAMMKHIKEHQAALDPDHPRDVLDYYLIELEQCKDPSQNAALSVEDLLALITELFLAGVETTTSFLRWFILYLSKNPDVQARLHQELDSVVPKDGFIFYHDRSRLPYLEAVIHEVQRCSSIAPLAVAHVASEDSQIEGYYIPKGTVVLPHLECCHRDPNFWTHPDLFHPDHFLNADGSFNAKKEGYLPFGIGRRSCAGESLAKVEVFVILTTLLRNFSFALPPGHNPITDKDPDTLIVSTPKPYRVIIIERK